MGILCQESSLVTLTPTFNPIIKMASTTGVNSFNKSKEDFIWFIKKATSDRKTDAHSELYHALLKMFVDADTNYDGLVSRDSFSILIDKAASIPRAYWFLVEIFTDEDSNKDGLITKRAFPAMMAKLLETPVKHQLSHADQEMIQEDEDKKIAHMEKLLVENNPRKDEKMTLDEWVQFAMEKVLKKFS